VELVYFVYTKSNNEWDFIKSQPEAHTNRQATQHDCLLSLLDDGGKGIDIVLICTLWVPIHLSFNIQEWPPLSVSLAPAPKMGSAKKTKYEVHASSTLLMTWMLIFVEKKKPQSKKKISRSNTLYHLLERVSVPPLCKYEYGKEREDSSVTTPQGPELIQQLD
jgi:hypothetical protein